LQKNIIKFTGLVGAMMAVYLPITFFTREVLTIKPPGIGMNTGTGVLALLTIVPVVVVLVLLVMKFDMVIAGFVGGALAMVISGVNFETASMQMMEAMPAIFMDTRLIIDAALAGVILRTGGYGASIALMHKITKIKPAYIGIISIAWLAVCIFFSGNGAGSAFIIAPLAFIATGLSPLLATIFSFIIAVCIILSPFSVESGIIANAGGFEFGHIVFIMIGAFLIALFVGISVGIYRLKRTKINALPKKEYGQLDKLSKRELFKLVVPLKFLVLCILFGPLINTFLGLSIMTPIVYLSGTLILIYLCTSLSANEVVAILIEAASHILGRLFQVALFFGFINIIASTGTFRMLANTVSLVSPSLMIPLAVLVSVLLAIPTGVHTTFVLGTMLPFVANLGFGPIDIWLVSLGATIGTQLSVANMGLQALSFGFDQSLMQIIKRNRLWVGIMTVMLVVIALFVSFIF